jgi:hypothetical protein
MAALAAPDFTPELPGLADISPKTLLGPLFSALLSPNALTRARASAAFGPAAARLAAARMEDARILMRRLMWLMNEESGNVGWGIPEAMGEIMACHEGLAREYHRILISYVQDMDKDCNFIDHPPLRRGAWRGIGRLAEVWPELAAPAAPECLAALSDCDPETRGLAARVLSLLPGLLAPEAEKALAALRDDGFVFELYRKDALETVTVGELANEALARKA